MGAILEASSGSNLRSARYVWNHIRANPVSGADMGSSLYGAPTSHLGTIMELCKGHTEGTWLVSEHFWNHPEANPSPGKKGHSCPNFPGGSKDTLRRRAVIMGPLGIVILRLSWLVLGVLWRQPCANPSSGKNGHACPNILGPFRGGIGLFLNYLRSSWYQLGPSGVLRRALGQV